jgi:hypothetical protein
VDVDFGLCGEFRPFISAAGIVVLDPLRRPLALDLSQSGSAQGLNLIALLGSDRPIIPCYVCKIRCYVKDFPC